MKNCDKTTVNTADFKPIAEPTEKLGGGTLNSAFAVTARQYRAAIRRHDWPDNPERLVRVILEFSIECERYKACVPTQLLFQELCGKMTKARVSECLEWLEAKFVIERGVLPVSYGGRRKRWTVYRLLPPEKWQVPERVLTTQRVEGIEQWLAKLDPDQPELIAPPASLNDLLVEDFVERAGTSIGAGHGSPSLAKASAVVRVESMESRESGTDRTGSPERGLGGVESKSKSVSHEPMVPLEGTKVETEAYEDTPKVPSGGTSQVPPQGTPLTLGSLLGNPSGSPTGNLEGGRGEFDSRYSSREVRTDTSNRVPRVEGAEVPLQGTSWLLDGYIRQKLERQPSLCRELVDGISADGRYSPLKACFEILWSRSPQRARELIGLAVLPDKRNSNSWLNTSVRAELGMQPAPKRGG